MSPSPRRSIKKKATVSGTGLHTGARTEAAFLPAAAGQGIVFRRVDLAGKPQGPAPPAQGEAGAARPGDRQGEATTPTAPHPPPPPPAPPSADPSTPLTSPPPP